MVNISFSDLNSIVSGQALNFCDCIAEGINIYSDLVKKNNIYFCINSKKYNTLDGSLGFTNNEDSVYGFGGTQNGHDEIEKVINNGASIIIIDDISYYNEDLNVGIILVSDTLVALTNLAYYFVKNQNIKVIAVTGSTGKSTTCQALVDSLSVFWNTKKIHRIRNSVLGMCMEILQNTSNETDCLIVEMQMDGYGQIQRFCDVIQPDIAIITNINFAHYSRFNSIEEVLFEKLAVYRNLKPNGYLLINYDNDILNEWNNTQDDNRILKVGISQNSDYSIGQISKYGSNDFCTFNAYVRDMQLSDITLQSPGIGLIYAALFSLAIVDLFHLQIDKAREGLKKISSPVGRFSCFCGKNGSKIIIDSYNASFDSMVQGIDYVFNSPQKSKILILGSMLELGEKTETEHRRLGKYISKKDQDYIIITVGEAAMYITAEIKNIPLNNIFCTFTYEDVVDIISNVPISSDTIVFIKGSGAMRLEIISPYLLANRIF